jgi:hypothetical protein
VVGWLVESFDGAPDALAQAVKAAGARGFIGTLRALLAGLPSDGRRGSRW